MKNIDVKSLLIGILATALLFACADADKTSPSIVSEAKAATGVNDKWDDKQEWLISEVPFSVPQNSAHYKKLTTGMEPFAINGPASKVLFRKRVK